MNVIRAKVQIEIIIEYIKGHRKIYRWINLMKFFCFSGH